MFRSSVFNRFLPTNPYDKKGKPDNGGRAQLARSATETPVTGGWTMSESATNRGDPWAVHVSFNQKFPCTSTICKTGEQIKCVSDQIMVEHHFAISFLPLDRPTEVRASASWRHRLNWLTAVILFFFCNWSLSLCACDIVASQSGDRLRCWCPALYSEFWPR
jgi:hypothetical protein